MKKNAPQQKQDNFNLRLAILRTIMCFMVILCHFWWPNAETTEWQSWLVFLRGFAVPVFMMLSFWGTGKSLIAHDPAKMKNRFLRLLIPQVGWAVIYWSVYKLCDVILGTADAGGISTMLWQMFTGHSPALNASMWFQVDLIFLTFLFLIVTVFCRKRYMSYLGAIGLSAFFIQYSELNRIFENYRYELAFPLGRFCEMIPAAVVGFYISQYGYFGQA